MIHDVVVVILVVVIIIIIIIIIIIKFMIFLACFWHLHNFFLVCVRACERACVRVRVCGASARAYSGEDEKRSSGSSGRRLRR